MERKVFLRNSLGFLGMAMLAPELLKAGQTETEALDCTVTASETAGPFPTINPSSLVQSNIVGDRTGIPLTINITINNKNGNCAAYEGALVDIWHCDKDGNYSEYGGTGMQPTNYTNYHFLRGRQTTAADGSVSFTSIFPGWYTGRATHIHVHIYTAGGTSLLVTQIAFPEGTNSAVATVNASTANGYTKGMTGYTYNASDNVFNNGISTEMSSITGSIAEGYTLQHTIYVNGPTLGTNEISQRSAVIGQNYPNPFSGDTVVPITLTTASEVTFSITDLLGKQIGSVKKFNFNSGTSQISLSKEEYGLSSGFYIYSVVVENASGTFTQSRKMMVK